MQLNFVFLTESVNGKGVAVKGKVHRFAPLDGKQKYTKQKAVNPFPFVSLPSKDKIKKQKKEVKSR